MTDLMVPRTSLQTGAEFGDDLIDEFYWSVVKEYARLIGVEGLCNILMCFIIIA